MFKDRITAKEDLELLIDFGDVPIGGVYWKNLNENYYHAPLRLGRSKSSGLVQLIDRYNANLYENYTFSGISSNTYEKHLKETAKELASYLGSKSKIFEVGASDGILLSEMLKKGFTTFGVEPSFGLVQEAKKNGLNIVQGYVTEKWASENVGIIGKQDAIIMRHVLEHLDDPNDMFSAFNILSHENTKLFLELPSLEGILLNKEYSSIFHEHVAYYDRSTLWSLLNRYGWGVELFKTVPIHGESFVILCSKGENKITIKNNNMQSLLQDFLNHYHVWKKELRAIITNEIQSGNIIAGWGASHRTAGIMAIADILNLKMTAIYDTNRLLQGFLHPPMGIPIEPPKEIDRSKVDTIIIFATSYQNEILKELKNFINDGGRVITLAGMTPKLLTNKTAE